MLLLLRSLFFLSGCFIMVGVFALPDLPFIIELCGILLSVFLCYMTVAPDKVYRG